MGENTLETVTQHRMEIDVQANRSAHKQLKVWKGGHNPKRQTSSTLTSTLI
jgi:hypothetical protein